MKKTNQELSSIFAVAEELVRDNGEDCFYYDAAGDNFIIAALDGCGGSGSKKYENFSGKTGAYMASRAVCGGFKAWFCESNEDRELPKYIQEALSVCSQYADKAGRILGSLGKSFPTTAAVIRGKFNGDAVEASCYWAGDSRCYMLDACGLHQLTTDDLDDPDAMSNLTNDGVMTNVINASSPFEIHINKITVNNPCVFITATDGCFGYLKSPMEFEHLLIDSLVASNSILEWKVILNERFHSVASDDYTLCVAACGFDSFDDIKNTFLSRAAFVSKNYIGVEGDLNALWDVYKKDYSMYL